MQKTLDACRWVYNKTLEVRRDAYEDEQESLSLYDTHNLLPQWKERHPSLTVAYAQSLQEAQQRVDLAFQHFFRRVKNGDKPGYPRFKGNWYKSFTYPQSGYKLQGHQLHLSKIGDIKVTVHRPIEGQIKRLTIKRTALGKWYAVFVCEVDIEPLPPTDNTVGIDVGCELFATFSDGQTIPNPRFFRQDEKALAKAQRRLAKEEKGTPEWRKYKRVVQHIHERIANRRKDFAHKLSRKIVDEYQVIAVEDLDIQDMQANNWHGLNKSISDAAWRQFSKFLAYKAEWAGREMVKVDPRNTSKICSDCGAIVEKELSDRLHKCPECGLELDRDHNAAKNILARGLSCRGVNP